MVELLQNEQETESNKIVTISSAEKTPESPAIQTVYDLIASFQKIKQEEQNLTEQKQELMATEKDLKNRILIEIEKKKQAIQDLNTEISALQRRCNELTLALGLPA